MFNAPLNRHLFEPGPKSILSLDGGGLRGAITVAFLERIEDIIAENHKKSGQSSSPGTGSETSGRIRLGDVFDLIGGTSTGAIVASALALGLNTTDLKRFYFENAPRVFKRRLHIPLVQSRYDAKLLHDEISSVVGNRRLDSEDFITGLAIVVKSMTSSSPLVLVNNPRAPYWMSNVAYRGMSEYQLATIICASTAAPTYFDPVISPLFEGSRTKSTESTGIGQNCMVDGGVTPHNNPALALLLLVLLKDYGICWPTGRDNLTIVSIGTGSFRPPVVSYHTGLLRRLRLAVVALESLIDDSSDLVLNLMQLFGDTPEDLRTRSTMRSIGVSLPVGATKWFRFLRYNVELEQRWLEEEVGLKLSTDELARVRRMDDARAIHRMYEIGQLAARRQVKAEHLVGL
jgi:predicted acylesterase/phospholipase RssA